MFLCFFFAAAEFITVPNIVMLSERYYKDWKGHDLLCAHLFSNVYESTILSASIQCGQFQLDIHPDVYGEGPQFGSGGAICTWEQLKDRANKLLVRKDARFKVNVYRHVNTALMSIVSPPRNMSPADFIISISKLRGLAAISEPIRFGAGKWEILAHHDHHRKLMVRLECVSIKKQLRLLLTGEVIDASGRVIDKDWDEALFSDGITNDMIFNSISIDDYDHVQIRSNLKIC